MKKPKPTWPGFMDEIKAVKKAPAFTDASFTAFFRETEGQNLTASLLCLPAYGDEAA
ncbi:MAG TPA: hypothetical protein OIL76_07730 [Veillonellaceae bacterium]|nr:hypothetical protein [Veillonellaceae bacterium]